MSKTYTYNASEINTAGKDKMRFELGDVMVDGGSETCALSDEEYTTIISSARTWKRAKFALLRSIMMRFGYEVNTTEGPLRLELQGRVEFWKKQYEELKAQLGGESLILPDYGTPSIETKIDGGHYFYGGMHDNPRTKGGDRRDALFKTGEPL